MKFYVRFVIAFCSSLLSCLSYAQSSLQAQWLAQTDLPLSTGPVYVTDAVRTINDDTYIIGNFRNGADFDTGPDTSYVRAPFLYSLFLAKYDKAGKLVFAEGMSGFGDQTYYAFNAIAADKNGNVYITGSYGQEFDFDPGPGVDSLPVTSYYDHNMFIAKYDTKGGLVWAEPVTSKNKNSYSSGIATDNQGNVCITGGLYGTRNDFDPGPGTAALNANDEGEAFIAKYDTNGNYLFANLIASDLGTFTSDITTDNNNNILLTGSYTRGTDFDPGPDTVQLPYKGGGDMFYAKYSPAGKYIFAKSIGGKDFETAYTILADKKNNIYLTGSFSGTNADFDPGKGRVVRSAAGGIYSDEFVEKFDSLGNYVWVNTAGGTSADNGIALALDTRGNAYVSGNLSGSQVVFHNTTGPDTLTSYGGTDIFFAKYDSLGTCIYVKQVGGAGNEASAHIFLTSQNNILLSGNLPDSLDFNPSPQRNVLYTPNNTVYFASYTNAGQYVSAQEINEFGWFNDESQLYKVTGDKAGNTYIIGQFQGITDFAPGPPDTVLLTSQTMHYKNGFTTSTGDKFFAKYDVNGKLVFVKTIEGTYDNTMNNITTDDDENIYICGGYNGKVNFSPGSDTAVFGSDNQYTNFGYFVKYDKNGRYVFAKNIQMPGGFASVITDKKKNIYVAGNFSNKANFNAPDSNAAITAIGGTDMFFGKYDSSGNYIYIKHIGQKGGRNTVGPTDMKITPSGRMVMCGELYGNHTDFNPDAGTYFLSSGKSTDAYFIAAYTLQGNFLFASAADTASTGYSYGQQLVLDGEDAVMSGVYRGAVDLDPGLKVTQQSNINLSSNFFIKFKSTGTLLFSNAFIPTQFVDGSQNNTITGIGVDSSHHIYIAGSYTVKTDFDFGNSTAFRDSSGSYIARYDSLGSYEYVQDFNSYAPAGGYAYNYATALWVSPKSEIVLAGDASGDLDLDPGPGNLLFHSPVYEHFIFYLAKYKDISSQQKTPLLISQAR